MLYTMKNKKDNKIYTLKSIDEVMPKGDNDLFIIKLDGSKVTYLR